MCNTSPFIVQAYECSDAVSNPPVFSSKFVTVPSLPMGPPPPLPCEYSFNSYSVLVPNGLPKTLTNNPFIPIPNEILGTLSMTETAMKRPFKNLEKERNDCPDVAYRKGLHSDSMSTIFLEHLNEYPTMPGHNFNVKKENVRSLFLTDTLNLLRFSKHFFKSFCHISKHVALRRSGSAPNLLKKNSVITSLFPQSKSWEPTIMESLKRHVSSQTQNIPLTTASLVQTSQPASHTVGIPQRTRVFQQNSDTVAPLSSSKPLNDNVLLKKKSCCGNDEAHRHLRTTPLLKKVSKPSISSKIILNELYDKKISRKACRPCNISIDSMCHAGFYTKFSKTVKNILDKKKKNLGKYSITTNKDCQTGTQTVCSKKTVVESSPKSEISSTRASEQKSIHRIGKTFANFSRIVPRYKHFNKVDISSDYRFIKKKLV